MPTFFIILFGVYLSGNVYIFIRGWQAISGLPLGIKIMLSILFWIGALSFLSILKLRDSNVPETIGHLVYEIGTGWLIFTLYMVLLLLVVDIFKLFHVQYAYSFYVVLGFTLCLLSYGYYNYRHPKTTTVDLVINKPVDIPSSQLKVIAISDIHLGYGTNKSILKEYVSYINKQNPDIIIIGGDLIDSSVTPLYKEQMDEELSQLNAPLGVYMALGNHEYISGLQASLDFLKKTPITLLQDRIITLPNQVQIIGRDDRSSRHRKPLHELIKSIDLTKPTILLDHQPYNLEEVSNAGIDLQFSGHTHRGQVWPMSWVTDKLFEVSYGYKQKGNTHFYISSGLSLWGPPFRIGTVSELVVFNITFES